MTSVWGLIWVVSDCLRVLQGSMTGYEGLIARFGICKFVQHGFYIRCFIVCGVHLRFTLPGTVALRVGSGLGVWGARVSG